MLCPVAQKLNQMNMLNAVMTNKYKPELFNNDNWTRSINTLIENMHLVTVNRIELDHWYDKLVKNIFTELDKNMSFIDIGREEVKRFKYYKPYWDTELKNCWHDLKDARKDLNPYLHRSFAKSMVF